MKETTALFLLICTIIGLYANTYTPKHLQPITITFQKNYTDPDLSERKNSAGGQDARQHNRTDIALHDGLEPGTPTTPAAQLTSLHGTLATPIFADNRDHTDERELVIQNMLQFIHTAETGRGTNKNPHALHNYCKSMGKSNEYGYGGMARKICFTDHAEATARINRWLDEHLTEFGEDVAKTLCYYNLGKKEINCTYYQKYLGAL